MTERTPMSDAVPAEPVAPPVGAVPELPAPLTCSQCGAARVGDDQYCGDCGFIYANEAAGPVPSVVPPGLVAGRFRLTQLLSERGQVARFRGQDEGTGGDPIPVIVVRQTAPADPPGEQEPEPKSEFEFDLPESVGEQATVHIPNPGDPTAWPGVNWEQGVLLRAAHLSLPRLIDAFVEDGYTYLIEEVPAGQSFWD